MRNVTASSVNAHSGDRSGTAVVLASLLATGFGSTLGFVYGLQSRVVQDDLSITRAQVGLIASIYFGSTGLGSLAGGRLADLLGARRAVVIDMVAVSAAATVAAAWGSYTAILLTSVIGGLGYALTNAATNLAVAAAVPLRHRALALTVKTAGVPFQVAVGSVLVPFLADHVGWRPVIAGVAALAGTTAIVVAMLLPDVHGAVALGTDRRLPHAILLLPVGCFFLLVASQPLFSWGVRYLDEAMDMRASTAGSLAALAALGGVGNMIVVARVSDVIGRERRAPLVFTLTGLTGAGGLLLAIGARGNLAVGLPGLVIATAAQLAAIGLLHALVVDIAPRAVGRASGVTMTGYYLGALVAPAQFGWLSDRSGSYAWPWLVCALSAACAATVFGLLWYVRADDGLLARSPA
jgi:MFS family permease